LKVENLAARSSTPHCTLEQKGAWLLVVNKKIDSLVKSCCCFAVCQKLGSYSNTSHVHNVICSVSN
jgi:hypothetical protein